MTTHVYPNITDHQSSVRITLNANSIKSMINGINFNCDIDPKTNQPVGVEIIDLAEQINNSKLELLEIEKQVGNVHWIVTYEPDYDVAYIGFSEKVKNLPLKTKQGRGSILIGKKGQILGFEFNISELF